MIETIPVPKIWVENCKKMVDEIWVPTQFHLEEFIKAGIPKEKLIKIPGY